MAHGIKYTSLFWGLYGCKWTWLYLFTDNVMLTKQLEDIWSVPLRFNQMLQSSLESAVQYKWARMCSILQKRPF